MNDFSISMALFDFIPVILFAISSVILMRDLYNAMSKGAFALFAAGTINVTAAGFLKALYKLLYALGVCNFQALSNIFFPLQSLGFLLAGIGITAMYSCRQKSGNTALAAAVPPLFTGTFVFVFFMVTGLFMIDAILSFIAAKLKKRVLILLFVLSFLMSLSMGYLSTKDFTTSIMNWAAEGVNLVGQGSFFLGTYLLHKSGLAGFIPEKDRR